MLDVYDELRILEELGMNITPSNNSTWDPTGDVEEVPAVVLGVLYSLLPVSILAGAGLAIALFCQRPTTPLMVHLGGWVLADLLVALVLMPLAGVTQVTGASPPGCQVLTATSFFFRTITGVTLLTLAVDRCSSVSCKTYSQVVTIHKTITFNILLWLTTGLLSGLLGSQSRLPVSLLVDRCRPHLPPLPPPPGSYVYPCVLLTSSLLLLVLTVATWRALKTAEEGLLTHAQPSAGSPALGCYLADGAQTGVGVGPEAELPGRNLRASRALLPVFLMDALLGTLQGVFQLPVAEDWKLGAGSVDGLLFFVRVTLTTLGILCGNPHLWRYILRWKVKVVCGAQPQTSATTADGRFRSVTTRGSRAFVVPSTSAPRRHFTYRRGRKKKKPKSSSLSVVVDQGPSDPSNNPPGVGTATHIELSVSSRNPSPVGDGSPGAGGECDLGGDCVRRYSNSSSISIAVSSRGASGQEDDFQMFINYPAYNGDNSSLPKGRQMSNTSSKCSLTSIYSVNLQNWDEPNNPPVAKRGSNKLSLCSVNSVDEHGFLTPAPIRHSYHFAREALPSNRGCTRCQHRSSCGRQPSGHPARPHRPRPPHSTVINVKPHAPDLHSTDVCQAALSQSDSSQSGTSKDGSSKNDNFQNDHSGKIPSSQQAVAPDVIASPPLSQIALSQPIFSQPGQILSPIPSPVPLPKAPNNTHAAHLGQDCINRSISESESSTNTWASKSLRKKRRLPQLQPATSPNTPTSSCLLTPALPRRGRSVPNNPFPKPETEESTLDIIEDKRLQRQTLPKMQRGEKEKPLTPVA